jgi:hypothetical protein
MREHPRGGRRGPYSQKPRRRPGCSTASTTASEGWEFESLRPHTHSGTRVYSVESSVTAVESGLVIWPWDNLGRSGPYSLGELAGAGGGGMGVAGRHRRRRMAHQGHVVGQGCPCLREQCCGGVIVVRTVVSSACETATPRFLLPESFQGALAHGRRGIVDLNIAGHLALGCRNAQGVADRRRGMGGRECRGDRCRLSRSRMGCGSWCGGDHRRGSNRQQRCDVAQFDWHGEYSFDGGPYSDLIRRDC